VSKPGPKPDEVRAKLRRLIADNMSDRTFATYYRAWCTLAELHMNGLISDEEQREVLVSATRPNGSFNTCKFARNTDVLLLRALARADAAEAS
jgi:hypothetical protein